MPDGAGGIIDTGATLASDAADAVTSGLSAAGDAISSGVDWVGDTLGDIFGGGVAGADAGTVGAGAADLGGFDVGSLGVDLSGIGNIPGADNIGAGLTSDLSSFGDFGSSTFTQAPTALAGGGLDIAPNFDVGSLGASAPSALTAAGSVAPAAMDVADIGDDFVRGAQQIISPATLGITGQELALPALDLGAGAAPMAAGAAAEGGGMLAGANDFLKRNGPLLTAGVAGANLLKSALTPAQIPQQRPLLDMAGTAMSERAQDRATATGMREGLQGDAAALGAESAALRQPLTTGQLPPGAQAGVNRNLRARQAQIRSKYAQMGLAGSSMEQQELASAAEASQAQTFDIASKMAQTGLATLDRAQRATGMAQTALQIAGGDQRLAAQIYQNLVNQALQDDADLGNAVADFATALAGGGLQPRVTSRRMQ